MLTRRTFIALTAMLSLGLSSGVPALALDRPLTPEETELIQRINEHHSAIRSMAGRFIQIDTEGNRTEGTFFIERPNKVRFKYGPPSKEEIVSQGSGFYVINREERSQYAYAQDQVPLRQFLGDQINLFNTNLIDVVKSEDFISVALSDETPIGAVEVALVFEIATLDLVQWTLTEPSGAETTFSMYDVEKNVDIPRAFFRIDPTYTAKTPG